MSIIVNDPLTSMSDWTHDKNPVNKNDYFKMQGNHVRLEQFHDNIFPMRCYAVVGPDYLLQASLAVTCIHGRFSGRIGRSQLRVIT